MPRPELGDTVLFEPPEAWKKGQYTMVGIVNEVELEEGADPTDERSYRLRLFIMQRDGSTGVAKPVGYDRKPKPDHWRWREARPYA